MAFEGKGLIVHDLPPTADALGGLATRLGCEWLAFKIHDGASAWGESRHCTPGYVAGLRASFAGQLHGWGYVYCDGLVDAGDRGDGVPEREARAALPLLTTVQPDNPTNVRLDGYIADFEIECEGHADLVRRFAGAFGEGDFNGPRGAFVWASLRGHDAYPSDAILTEWLGGSGTVMPMVYRPEWNAGDVNEWTQRWPFTRVVPTLSVYPSDFELVRFDAEMLRQRQARLPGLSLWAGDAFLYASPGMMPPVLTPRYQWYRDLRWPQAFAPTVDPERWRSPIWTMAGDLANAGFPEGVGMQTLIRWGKGEVDLSDDTRRALGIPSP